MKVSQAYAVAAYRYAQQQDNVDSWLQLISLAGTIQHSGIKNPKLLKSELLELLSHHLHPDEVQLHWLKLIVNHQHMHLMPSITEHFIHINQISNRTYNILFRTAHPLSKTLTQKILKHLRSKKDKVYNAKFIVDPSIIGGVKIEYRGKQYDYSFANTLNQLIAN